MKERVVIQGGGVSPLRISVVGVDASSAQFNNLIFDGNQPPLRLWGVGYVTSAPLASGSGATVTSGSPATVITTPSGAFPLFLTMVRQPLAGGSPVNPGAVGNQNTPAFRTLNNYGSGILINNSGSNNLLYGINFNRDNPTNGLFGTQSCICNYAVLKNYA